MNQYLLPHLKEINMKVSDIPYEYVCSKPMDCLCTLEQTKRCYNAKKIVDEYRLIKLLKKEEKDNQSTCSECGGKCTQGDQVCRKCAKSYGAW
jgi:hypothetical protein